MILNDLLTLFRDDSLEVFYGVVTYLPDTLDTYMKCYHNATTHLETKVSTNCVVAACDVDCSCAHIM